MRVLCMNNVKLYPILQDMQITFKIVYLTFFENCEIHMMYSAL
jgi:hypothetical protein